MIQLANRLWIGDSAVTGRDLMAEGVGAVLNVAQDLRGYVGWPDVEYMQVGLVDGPGNPLSSYYAAVLALGSLLKRHGALVFCHTGSRSVVVAAMYVNVGMCCTWDRMVTMLSEKVDEDLPTPHEAHIKAFGEMDWKQLRKILEEK